MNSLVLLTAFPFYVYEYHGFLLWRHESNESTCIKYKSAQGEQKVIAVKDAKFRSIQKFGAYGKESSLTNFTAKGIDNSYFIYGNSTIGNIPTPEYVNNDNIYNQWSTSLRLDKTAKENCNVWMTYNTSTDSKGVVGVPAVAYCRNQKVNNIPCDLPNIYQTIVIWACGDKLDEMDPTASSYPYLKLGYTAFGDGSNSRTQEYNGILGYELWSSTEYDSYSVRRIGYSGYCSFDYKWDNYTVVPILEL